MLVQWSVKKFKNGMRLVRNIDVMLPGAGKIDHGRAADQSMQLLYLRSPRVSIQPSSDNAVG